MSIAARTLVAASLVIVGYVAGSSSPERRVSEPEAHEPEAHAPRPKRPASRPTRAWTAPEPEPDLTTAWCEARLRRLQEREAALRLPWPEDLGVEEPSEWTAAVERVFAECDLPWHLETIDCTEYPCAAELVADSEIEDDAFDYLGDCPAAQALPSPTIHQIYVSCADGPEDTVPVLLAYDDDRLTAHGDFLHWMRIIARRMDDVAARHRCP